MSEPVTAAQALSYDFTVDGNDTYTDGSTPATYVIIVQLSSLPFVTPTVSDQRKLYEASRAQYEALFADMLTSKKSTRNQ